MDLANYTVIHIPKGYGKYRIIHAPNEVLKFKQRQYLENEMSARPKMPRWVTSFWPGRSIKDAAKYHVGKKYLVHVDIEDYFHYVTPEHTVRNFLFEGLLPGEIDTRCMSLKGRNIERIIPPVGLLDLAFIPSPKDPKRLCLPQGSPLSPFLANLEAKKIFFMIRKMFKKKGVEVDISIYADGIYMSSNSKSVIPMGRHGVERILSSEGFRVNRKKFRVMRKSDSQKVCGVIVNEKLALPRHRRRMIRGRIHHLYRDALNAKELDIHEFRVVEGHLAQARHISPGWASKYLDKMMFVRLYLKGKQLI